MNRNLLFPKLKLKKKVYLKYRNILNSNLKLGFIGNIL